MQKSLAREVTDPRGKPIDFLFLNSNAFQLPSKYLCLYPQVFASATLGQRSFLLQRAVDKVCINSSTLDGTSKSRSTQEPPLKRQIEYYPEDGKDALKAFSAAIT